MDRRQFIRVVGSGALGVTLSASAQQAGRVYRIGWLGNSRLDTPETLAGWDAFRLELQSRGWSEGRNVAFEQRFAAGVSERHPENVRELIELKVDLILATSGPAARAARKATDTIPIVFVAIPNPVEQGLVANLARPGGNVTGLSTQGLDLVGKRLELLKEAFPRASRVAFLAGRLPEDQSAYQAAEKLGVQLLPVAVRRPEDLSGAMAELAHADAWFVGEYAIYFAHRSTIIELVARQRKPVMYPSTFFVAAGGLMSYSVAQKDQSRRAAAMVDRILRGARPADMPVEQPTKFELVINLKTAKALGLTIPPSLLQRADEVIQ